MTYQPLISGTNIKTIDNQPILGSGNITIGGTSQPDSTELWLKFNGANNSTDFIDESKNNYLIVPLNGNPIISVIESKFGGSSLYLNGSSSLAAPSINFKTDWTVELWFKTNSSGYITLCAQDAGNANEQTFLITPVGCLVYYNYAYPVNPVLDDNKIINDNLWHHTALVRDKKSIFLYIDGVLKQSLSNLVSLDYATITPFRIGFMPSYGRFFTGYIDNLRISSKAIYTPTLYPNGFTLPDESFNVTAL